MYERYSRILLRIFRRIITYQASISYSSFILLLFSLFVKFSVYRKEQQNRSLKPVNVVHRCILVSVYTQNV